MKDLVDKIASSRSTIHPLNNLSSLIQMMDVVKPQSSVVVSGSSRTGCGWTEVVQLEDEDDRQRLLHHETHLGQGSR